MGSLCATDMAIEDEKVAPTEYDPPPPPLTVVVTDVSNRFAHLPKHERERMKRVQAFFENGYEWPECSQHTMKTISENSQ
jgi:hypothetical protein